MKMFIVSKTRSWLLMSITSVLTVLAVSCQKDNQFLNEDVTAKKARITGDYEVRGGTLYFRDSDAFLTVHTSLTKMTYDERLKFAETAGFKSLLVYSDEFLKASEATTDKATFDAVLAKYTDIVSLDKDRTPVFNVQSFLLASYLDRTGVVYIGKALYKFGDWEQTIVLDGDRAKLNAPESAVVKRISHLPGTKAGARLATSTCQYFYNREGGTFSCGDRKSRLSVYPLITTVQQGNGQYQTTLTPYAIGLPFKKNGFGNWVNYRTNNTLFSHWTFSAYTTEPGQPAGPGNPLTSLANYVYSNDWDSIEY